MIFFRVSHLAYWTIRSLVTGSFWLGRRANLNSSIHLRLRTRRRSCHIPSWSFNFNHTVSIGSWRKHVCFTLDFFNFVALWFLSFNMIDGESSLLIHMFDVNYMLQDILSGMLYFQHLVRCVAIMPMTP